jgi:hypothetical protein
MLDFIRKTSLKWSFFEIIQEIPETGVPPFQLVDQTITDAYLYFSILPTSGWDKISEGDIKHLVNRCQQFNQNGRSVILRFAPEMNVPWHAWGMQPAAFKKNWNLLLRYLDSLPDADRTALVWSPFDGSNYPYPFADSTYFPKPGSPDFIALDTNFDGKIDGDDNPYSPYLPTNTTSMDWVGLSIYWQDQTSVGVNLVPPSTRLRDILVGNINNKPNFYTDYVIGLQKPMLIASTGAVFYSGGSSSLNPTELAVKSAWWQQWLSSDFSYTFPDIKMICISEANNHQRGSNINFDFRITNQTNILSSFKADLAAAASTFSVQWALSANLNTWQIPNNGENRGVSSSLSFDSIILVGILGGAFLLVSVWIGVSFFTYQLKKEQSARNTMTFLLSDEEKESTPQEIKFVEDNSTIFGGSQDLGRSFDSQNTTSDDFFQRSLSIEAADFDYEYKRQDMDQDNGYTTPIGGYTTPYDPIVTASDSNDGIFVMNPRIRSYHEYSEYTDPKQ